MSPNRFEQVESRQDDAVTLFLLQAADGPSGYLTCPAVISHGLLAEDQASAVMPARDAFRSAVRLANEIKAPLVVADPEGLWLSEWGSLHHADDGL